MHERIHIIRINMNKNCNKPKYPGLIESFYFEFHLDNEQNELNSNIQDWKGNFNLESVLLKQKTDWNKWRHENMKSINAKYVSLLYQFAVEL